MAEFGVALVLAQIAVDEKSNEITAMPKLLEMLSLPAGLEPGSPFTQSIEATAIYMRYEHAVSYRCLSKLFADLYGGQRGLGEAWQICLAHQLRDCQYAIDAGDAIFAPGMKMLILRACVLARRRNHLKDNTLRQYRGNPERRMDKLMACQSRNP